MKVKVLTNIDWVNEPPREHWGEVIDTSPGLGGPFGEGNNLRVRFDNGVEKTVWPKNVLEVKDDGSQA